MTEISMPFDSGAGSNVTEADWANFAQWFADNGAHFASTVGTLLPFGDSSGRQSKLPAGEAHINGFYYQNTAQQILAHATNGSGNARIDRMVARLDRTNNTITANVLTGTPGVSPSAPALTQNSTIWEINLAQIAIANGYTTIAVTDVTDERYLGMGANSGYVAYTPVLTASGSNPTLGSGANQLGHFRRDGKSVLCRGRLQVGNPGFSVGSGTYRISLPIPPEGTFGYVFGSAFFYDASLGGLYPCTAMADLGNPGAQYFAMVVQAKGVYVSNSFTNPNGTTIAPAGQDEMWWNFQYESA